MTGRLGLGLRWIIICALFVCCAVGIAADDECALGLYYTGDLFDKYGATQFCAQVGCPYKCAPTPEYLSGLGVWFQATNLWGITRTSGPSASFLTNAVGTACVRYNLNPGVYEVQAFGSEGSLLDGIASPPVAVTTFNCMPGIGIVSAGAITLNSCKRGIEGTAPPPDEECGCMEYVCRRATFGLYSDWGRPSINPWGLPKSNVGGKWDPIEFTFNLPLPDAKNEQLLFLDPLNPEGAVKVKVTNFQDPTLCVFVHLNFKPLYAYVRFDGLKIRGYCEFSVGGEEPQAKYFEATLSHHYWVLTQSPYFKFKDATFDIRVWEYPNKTLYHASGPIEDGRSLIF